LIPSRLPGQPAGPARPPAPAPALTAVKLMYAGAAVSAAGLIIELALIIVDTKGAAGGRFFGHTIGPPRRVRRDGAVLRRHHGVHRGLAGRRRRGMAALAPGLQRVLQAAGPHARPALVS